MVGFKAMGLYRDVDRIDADLAAAGHRSDGPLRVVDLAPFDQYHYEGAAAVESAARELQLGSQDRVLDVGSGIGGPARVLADGFGCRVTALEIQSDLHHVGERLTRRCGLGSQVEHRCGDILAGAGGEAEFDALVSMLCFLHIPDRATLFEQCMVALRPNGRVLIDDYATSSPLTNREVELLADRVQCPSLPSVDEYVRHLTDAGFGEIEVIDKTPAWRIFVADRYRAFSGAREELIDRYGAATVDGLDEFYGAVAEIFAGPRIAGVRIRAKRH